jgi:hypothetical protein
VARFRCKLLNVDTRGGGVSVELVAKIQVTASSIGGTASSSERDRAEPSRVARGTRAIAALARPGRVIQAGSVSSRLPSS